MRPWKKISLAVLAVLLIGGAVLAVWQQENLKALYTFLTNDSQSVVQDLENKNQQQQDALNKDYNVNVQAPSIEQSDGLLDGKLDPEEVKESLGITQPNEPKPEQKPAEVEKEEIQPQEPDEDQSVQQPDTDEGEKRQEKIDALVNQCVAELYACEVDLMAQLGAMKKAALEEWKALPEEERTQDKKLEIGFVGLEKCYDLEVVIDEKVEGILENYRGQLEKLGGDTSVIGDLWNYYCEKKVSEKAYYMEKYLG